MSEDEVSAIPNGNPMLKPRIEKITVNISVGKSGEPLENAVKILESLTGQRPCRRKAKQTIRDFGIRKGESIACLVTLRGDKGRDFLKLTLQAIDNRLFKRYFDNCGNFSFGITEHINLPGVKYVPELGIYGMDVCVTMGKPGYRVKRRHHARSRVGSKQLLSPDEAMLFIRDEFNVEITG